MKQSESRPSPAHLSRPRERAPWRPGAQLARNLLHRICSRWSPVPFRISYWDGMSQQYGVGTPEFHVTIRDPAALWHIFRSSEHALGEGYMTGAWEVDNLDRLLDVLLTAPFPQPLP